MRASTKGNSGKRARQTLARANCELLEGRLLLSAASHPTPRHMATASPMFVATRPLTNGRPFGSQSPPAGVTTPSQMRHFYGVDAINFAGVPIGNGQGQTIAIVDAFDDPVAFT